MAAESPCGAAQTGVSRESGLWYVPTDSCLLGFRTLPRHQPCHSQPPGPVRLSRPRCGPQSAESRRSSASVVSQRCRDESISSRQLSRVSLNSRRYRHVSRSWSVGSRNSRPSTVSRWDCSICNSRLKRRKQRLLMLAASVAPSKHDQEEVHDHATSPHHPQ
jgi:hypothetical protein